MTYDEAMHAADMFTAAMAEAGYPLEKPTRVVHDGDGWRYRWFGGSAPVEVRYKAAALVSQAFRLRYACLPCWIDSGRGRDRDHCRACASGHCPYEHEVSP